MRLLDRINIEGCVDVGLPAGFKEMLDGYLKEAQLVLIDNVAQYWNQQFLDNADKQEVNASDFPNVTPPFPFTFLEFRPSASSRAHAVYEEVGVLVFSTFSSLGDNNERPVKEYVRKQFQPLQLAEEAEFATLSYILLRTRHVPGVIYGGECLLPINKEGRIIPIADGKGVPGVVGINPNLVGDGVNAQGAWTYLAKHVFYPTLLALSFMHCRNVQVVQETPPPKLSKKHERKTGRPLLRYRVLQIDHMKEVLEKEGGASKTGLKRALHICRGHFAHYGEAGKGLLFGKYAGTVWVPMHTRGTKEKGVVIKDYDVK